MLNRLTEVRLHVVVYLGYLPYLIGQDEKAQCHCTVKALHAHKVENCNKWFLFILHAYICIQTIFFGVFELCFNGNYPNTSFVIFTHIGNSA